MVVGPARLPGGPCGFCPHDERIPPHAIHPLPPPPQPAARRPGRRRPGHAGRSGTADLSKVTLRIGTYKGLWRPLIAASGQGQTPYRIEWRELNNGVLHIEAINGDALDLGSGSEIPALFAVRQKAQVRFIAVVREDLNNQVTLARKDAPIQRIADLKGKRVGYVRATTSHYYRTCSRSF
jgi:sulfonate transport system substrate-binding protein